MPKKRHADDRRLLLLASLKEQVRALSRLEHSNPELKPLFDSASNAVKKGSIKPLRAWERQVGGPEAAHKRLLKLTNAGATFGVVDTVRELLES